MNDIAKNMSSLKNDKARWVENDLSSFEFGISAKLKECGADILRSIAAIIGVDDVGTSLFERVINDRTKSAVWVMNYTDEAGARAKCKLTLPCAMRESGDRLTSSGNWLQNLIARCSMLTTEQHMHQAIETLIGNRGERMFYRSARDGKKYIAIFVFEGDDTLGRFENRYAHNIT